MPNPYDNDANFLSHYESTGPEIWEQTDGTVTRFLTGCGTGGTITGTGTFLKEKNRDIRIIAIQAQKIIFYRDWETLKNPQFQSFSNGAWV